jgi:hypothetical protein
MCSYVDVLLSDMILIHVSSDSCHIPDGSL